MENNPRKCKHCQEVIDEKAKKCPHCQTDLRSWLSRHPILTFLGLLIFVPIALSSLNKSEPTSVNGIPDQPQLELLNFECYTKYDYFIIEGEVKNISSESIKSVEAVGSAYAADKQFVSSNSVLIEYNPILSGQTSPFKIIINGNPEIKSCKVGFKKLMGGTIHTKIDKE